MRCPMSLFRTACVGQALAFLTPRTALLGKDIQNRTSERRIGWWLPKAANGCLWRPSTLRGHGSGTAAATPASTLCRPPLFTLPPPATSNTPFSEACEDELDVLHLPDRDPLLDAVLVVALERPLKPSSSNSIFFFFFLDAGNRLRRRLSRSNRRTSSRRSP